MNQVQMWTKWAMGLAVGAFVILMAVKTSRGSAKENKVKRKSERTEDLEKNFLGTEEPDEVHSTEAKEKRHLPVQV